MDTRAHRLTVALAAAAVLLFSGASAPAADPAQPLIVKIHADWCGTCVLLNDTFEALERELGSEARIVVLDVTDRDATLRSRAQAEDLGIADFFERYKGKTGTVGILTASGKPIAVLKGETRTEKYRAAVAQAREQPTS